MLSGCSAFRTGVDGTPSNAHNTYNTCFRQDEGSRGSTEPDGSGPAVCPPGALAGPGKRLEGVRNRTRKGVGHAGSQSDRHCGPEGPADVGTTSEPSGALVSARLRGWRALGGRRGAG